MTDVTPADQIERDRHGSIVAGISRDIVGIHSRYYGRGPTRSKTIWREEIVCCVLGDIFTRAEQLLVGAGRFEEVRAHRTAFQDEVAPLFRGAVEERTRLRVEAFLSQVSKEGAATEVFVLAGPVNQDGR
jgi:uncharacterized protein YbcI